MRKGSLLRENTTGRVRLHRKTRLPASRFFSAGEHCLNRLVSCNARRRDFQKHLYIEPNFGEAQFAGRRSDEIQIVGAFREERNQFRHGQIAVPDHHFFTASGEGKIFAEMVLQFRHIHITNSASLSSRLV
jgi:hypothetical protein